MTERETDVEETVMLTRRDRRRAAETVPGADDPAAPSDVVTPAAPAAPEVAAASAPDDEPREPLDEATVVVDRSRASSAQPAGDEAHEATVVVSRPARRSRRRGESVEAHDPAGDSGAGVEAADADDALGVPVEQESAFAAPAVPTPAIYKPRPAPVGPSAPPAVVGSAAPTRQPDPAMPSVARQSRRWSALVLGALATACVVSVAGLVGVGFLVFG